MNQDSSAKRRYDSPLRADQARATRERIVDAAIALIREGLPELTFTTVAVRAGTSVATVYRHFPDRNALFFAVRDRADGEHAGVDHGQLTLGELREGLRAQFARFDDPDDVLNGARRLHGLFEFSRVATVPRRRALFTRLLDQEAAGVPEPQRTYLIDLGVVLLSSAIVEAFHGYLDRSGAETADRVGFALDALFAHARSQALPPEAR
jgi:AcrR family transcriptional regulator